MLKTAKFVGLNSDTAATLALISSLPGGASEIYFFALISCTLDDAFSLARQALSEAENTFSSSDKPISERLSETSQAARDFLKEQDQSGQDTEGVEILLAATEDREVETFFYLLGQEGSLEASLLRGEEKINLSGMSQGQLISGILKEGDRVVLATRNLEEILGGDLKSLGSVQIENLEDEIGSRLPEAEVSPLAVIVAEKEKKVVEGAQEVAEVALPTSDKITFKVSFSEFGRKLIALVPHSPKVLISFGVLVLIGLSLVVFLINKNKNEAASFALYNSQLKIASEEYAKADSLKDSDSSEALQSLNRAKQALDQALKIKPKEGSALDLKNKIENASPSISKSYSVTGIPLWLDLDLIKKDFQPKNFSLSLGKLLLLDTNKSNLILVNLDSKAYEILAGEDKLGEAEYAALNGYRVWVISKDKGLLRLDTEEKKVTSVSEKDEGWGEIKGIYGFGGNAYLLDSGNNQIWKYIPGSSGFSDKKEYLKDKADLGEAKRMQIDSSIWVLKGKNEILKFTQGSRDYFSLSGLEQPLGDLQSFFVSDETDNIYLLEGKRLIVVDKKGQYKAEYQSDKFGQFTDVVIDEKGKKVYLLEGSKIYQLELK